MASSESGQITASFIKILTGSFDTQNITNLDLTGKGMMEKFPWSSQELNLFKG